MAPRRCTHPIARYVQLHDWEWVPEEQIINAVGCTQKDLRALVSSRGYKHLIEHRNGEYRYIGNNSSERRRGVELLKAVYPEWLPGAEIMKRADLGKNAGWVFAGYYDVLPIETKLEHQKYKSNIKLYRYVPNDPRSLLNHDPTVSAKSMRVNRNKREALKLMKKHKGLWFSALEIATFLGHDSGWSMSQALVHLSKSEPNIHVKMGKATYHNKRYYCYSEKPMEADA